MNGNLVSEFFKSNQDFIRAFDGIYLLTEDKVQQVYQDIMSVLITKYKQSPDFIKASIIQASYLRNKHLKAYWKLYSLLTQHYSNDIFSHELRTLCDLSNNREPSFRTYIYIYEPGTILHVILNDDFEKCKQIINDSNFDINFQSKVRMLNYNVNLNLIEWCAYYGAENCFKFLILNNNFILTEKALNFSLLGGNQFIVNKCFREVKPNGKQFISQFFRITLIFLHF